MQAVSNGTLNIDRSSYEISNECTLSKVDEKEVLFALGEKLEFHLNCIKITRLKNT